MKFFICKIMTIYLFFGLVYGYQTKAVRDNETIQFNISNREYSRIFVTGDRIKSVKGKSRFYEIKEFGQEDDGVLFIKPTNITNSSVTIHLTTELRHHYTLELIVTNSSAENIEIKPLSIPRGTINRWEQNVPYTQKLVELLKIMVNQSYTQDYSIIDFTENKVIRLINGVVVKLIKIYQGNLIRGEIWAVQNENQKAIHLSARNFYKTNVRAISISKADLNPTEKTIIYRILSV